MSEYKNIIGTHIKTVTTDPPNPENGQMWYNSTTRVVKGFTANPAGSWSTGGALGTARDQARGTGTLTAGLVFGGDPEGPFTANTEAWDGSSWTEVADLNTARSTGGGFGSQTSAIMASGYTPSYVANTEFYDGTSWSEVNDVATARTRMGSNGPTGSSGMIVGGMEPSMSALVEEWVIPDFETKTVTTS